MIKIYSENYIAIVIYFETFNKSIAFIRNNRFDNILSLKIRSLSSRELAECYQDWENLHKINSKTNLKIKYD